MISIIVPVYNQLDMTYDCIQAVRETTTDCELIIVDNGSDPAFEMPFMGFIETKVIRNEDNRGYPAAVNQGMREARGEVIILLNNDVIVTNGWADRLVKALDEYAIVAPVTNYCAGMQKVYIGEYENQAELNERADAWADNYGDYEVEEVNWIIGFCMAFTKSLIDELGYFDESLWPSSGEELDFCLTARSKGHKVGIVSGCYVHHFGSKTFNEMDAKGQLIYEDVCKLGDERVGEKWGGDFWNKQAIDTKSNQDDGSLPLRLNLGCGAFRIDGFINIDRLESVICDQRCDVMSLPYAPGTVDEIYCGHLLEHLTYDEGQAALKHWYGVLKPGGKISISVPDMDVVIKRYADNMTVAGLRELADYYVFSYVQESSHRYLYSEALLRYVMEAAGFRELKRMPYDHPYFAFRVDWQVGIMGSK